MKSLIGASQREATDSLKARPRSDGGAGLRDLPPAVDEQLREAAAGVRLVRADAVAAANEVLGVGVERRLQALADRVCLLPVTELLRLDPRSQRPCACDIHSCPPCRAELPQKRGAGALGIPATFRVGCPDLRGPRRSHRHGRERACSLETKVP